MITHPTKQKQEHHRLKSDKPLWICDRILGIYL